MKPIIETIARMWKAFKAWVSEHPTLIKMLRREWAKRNQIKARTLFQPLPDVKVYLSQVTYRPVAGV
ncbi:hypothetical protein P9847_18640 [Paenibacillus chibensis]|uniref:Group II intron maturase-specific domain-containing protein n=1 Tax=Paenibacillus chibensis TaxID=59846 RepID=A0ABU6PZ24_9BACL|nr:hypothetical protein [Paenibacillus chibensis]